MKQFIYAAILTLISSAGAQPDGSEYGEITLQIGDQPEQALVAETVMLYENVTIIYDTTLYLNSGNTSDFYYSPQLEQGTHYVLHIILKPEESAHPLKKTPVYDVYLDLGDTLTRPITMEHTDSTVFFHGGGQLTNRKLYSRNLSGRFDLERDENNLGVAGKFETEFEYPLTGVNEYSRIKLNGNLIIPEENLRRGGETQLAEVSDENKKLMRNVLVAATLSILIVLFAIQ